MVIIISSEMYNDGSATILNICNLFHIFRYQNYLSIDLHSFIFTYKNSSTFNKIWPQFAVNCICVWISER